MTPTPQAHDPRSRIALACSALARAGQQLSVVTTGDQARAALLNVAGQLEADRNLADHFAADETAKKCREASHLKEDAHLLTTCRQVATALARRASSLAAEIQHQPKVGVAPAPSAIPIQATRPPEEQPRPVAPFPATPPLTRPGPQPAPTPPPQVPTQPPAAPPSRPVVDPARLRRISVAGTASEQAAVGRALETGERFAAVDNSVLIDTHTNRMWLAQAVPGLGRKAVEAALGRLHQGGYQDWRLPSPEELTTLLAQGGTRALQAASVLPASPATSLWTAQIRSRFFGLKKEAVVVHSATGDLAVTSFSDPSVLTLAVRG